jgi:ParB family chromosome partitioning protein
MGWLPKKGIYDTGRVLFLPVEDISPNPNQPRRAFSPSELEELSHSIAAMGILQPLTVCRRENGWELVAGERRLRAAKMAGLSQVPCLSVQLNAQSSSLLALVENLQRQDLNFWEEALALKHLTEDFCLSQEEVARRIGKSQSAVANKLRLLKLSPEVLALLRSGGCTERHARALLRLPDGERQLSAAQKAVQQGLTVAQTEALVESMLSNQPKKPQKRPTFIVKDVRLFLNTINHNLDLMRSAGVDAQCQRQDSEEEILLTIRIPRRATP